MSPRDRHARWHDRRRTLTCYLLVAAVALAVGGLIGWGLA